MKNKVEMKNFMGTEVRVINDEYIVLKDMFRALGRLNTVHQIETTDRNKLSQFLLDLDKESASKTFTISSKGKKGSREEQNVECLKLSTAPIVLTQFKPTSRKGKEALRCWVEFMKFVDVILTSLEVHKYIVTDKKKQLNHNDMIFEMGGKPMIENKMVNKIMGELVGIDFPLKKDDLRLYQDQTTIDLLEVREYVLTKFENAYEITNSHKESCAIALRLARNKYKIA